MLKEMRRGKYHRKRNCTMRDMEKRINIIEVEVIMKSKMLKIVTMTHIEYLK